MSADGTIMPNYSKLWNIVKGKKDVAYQRNCEENVNLNSHLRS